MATAVRELTDQTIVRVLLRGYKTARSPPLDDMARRILDDRLSAKDIAEQWRPKPLTQGELLDRFLLALWDALFLNMCEEWTRKGVSNIASGDTLDLVSWWTKGQNVGGHALCDHLCAMCGVYLSSYQSGQSTNFLTPRHGPPIDRDGQHLVVEGEPQTGAQPPFLLRFSPALIAKDAPEIFEHDPATNRLSLRAGRIEPWFRTVYGKPSDKDTNTWCYCDACHNRWISRSGHAVSYTHLTLPTKRIV